MVSEKDVLTSAEKSSQFTNVLTSVFKNKALIKQFNLFDGLKNYINKYVAKINAITKPIGIIFTEDDSYLMVINVEEYAIVIGPTCEVQPTDEHLDEVAALLGMNAEQTKEFHQISHEVCFIPIGTAILMACADYHLLTGIRLNPVDILRIDEGQNHILSREEDKRWRSFQDFDESMLQQEALYHFEKRLCHAVMTGREEEVGRVMKSLPGMIPMRGADQLGHYKNTFVICVTLVSRSITKCGVPPVEALSMADYYIVRCDRADTPAMIMDLMRRMVGGFIRLVQDVNKISTQSEFVGNVDGYIEQHMTEKITVEDMARDMLMSRNTLSGRFKKETGYILSEYIIMKKVERAKYILINTDLSLAEISAYLAFSSQSHFQKIFKQYTKKTPYEFKKTNY